MKGIQERLEDWAKEAYDFYYPKAKELDMDFYTQSNLVVIYWMGMSSMVSL